MSLTNPGGTDLVAHRPGGGRLGRRHFLHGLGVTVALPFLASLRPTARLASRAFQRTPNRKRAC